MPIQYINTGTGPNSGDGDSLRSAFTKINANFNQLYAANTANSTIIISDVAPSSPELGTFWFDVVSGRSYIYYDDSWVDSNPTGSAPAVDLTTVTTHILPAADLTYDLGSTSSQWRSLYVGTSTIYIGGKALSVTSSGDITVDGSPVSGGSAGGTTSTLTAGTATLSINTLSETILPSGLTFAPIENYGFGFGGTFASQTYGEQLQVLATGTGAFGLFGWGEVIGGPGGVAYVVGNQEGTNEVKIVAGSYTATVNTWKFGDDGQLTIPRDILGSGDQNLVIQNTASGVAYLELPVDPSTNSVILANQAASSATVTIRAGDFGNERDWTFNEFGSLSVPGVIYNNDPSNVGQLLLAGDVGEPATYLALPSDVGSTSMNVRLVNSYGDVQLVAGNNKSWYFKNTGGLELPGGSVLATSGYDVALVAGNDGTSTFGTVTINTQYPPDLTNRNWQFNSLGEFYLPLGGAIQETVVTNELWGTTTTSLTLVPAGAANGTQRLEIYSTGGGEGNHIHITSGDQTQTDLFLGNDTQYFSVGAMGQMEVRARPGLASPSPGTGAYAGSPVWIYAGDAGGNGGNQADGALGGDILLEAGSSSLGPVGLGGSVYLKSGNGISGYGSIKLSTDNGSTHLEFDKDGRLTLPSGGTLGPEGMGASGLSNGTSGNPVYIVNKKTNGDYLANIILTAGDGISGEITFEIWNTQTASTKTLSINTACNLVFDDGSIQSTAFTGTSALLDITNTNGIDTTYYLTFVENRLSGQEVRADVDLTWNSWSNTLGLGGVAFADGTTQTTAYGFVSPPVSSTSTGVAGALAKDATYFYVCTATNSWQRIAWDNTPW